MGVAVKVTWVVVLAMMCILVALLDWLPPAALELRNSIPPPKPLKTAGPLAIVWFLLLNPSPASTIVSSPASPPNVVSAFLTRLAHPLTAPK